MSNPDIVELKPCPFCGAAMSVQEHTSFHPSSSDCWLGNFDHGQPLELDECDYSGWNRRSQGGGDVAPLRSAPDEPVIGGSVMNKWRKKPVIIDAWQWTLAMDNGREPWPPTPIIRIDDGPPTIETLEGKMTVSVGDWIIKGVKGEFYPCKPDIFAASYEPAE